MAPRYEHERPVDARTDAEARAPRTIAGLIENDRRVIPDRAVAGRLGEVLRTCANKLGHGRGLLIPVRRAVLHLAGAVRMVLDPRTDSGRDVVYAVNWLRGRTTPVSEVRHRRARRESRVIAARARAVRL